MDCAALPTRQAIDTAVFFGIGTTAAREMLRSVFKNDSRWTSTTTATIHGRPYPAVGSSAGGIAASFADRAAGEPATAMITE